MSNLKPYQKQPKDTDKFRANFAEGVTELAGIKGSFLIYTFLIICLYLGLTIYGIILLDDWLFSSIFGVLGLVSAIIGGLFSGVWLILAILKWSLKTISNYVFISYNNLLLDEIDQAENDDGSFRSSTAILKQYSQDVVAPVIAGIICAFIPVLGGFIVGRVEKSIKKTSEKLAQFISTETKEITDKKEQYLTTIEIVKQKESVITPRIQGTFSVLIFPFLFISVLYLVLAFGSFIYLYQ